MTLFTLSNDIKQTKRTMFIYLGVTIFCAIFGIIYECFSHGVLSTYMLFGFLFPLFLGLLPYFLLGVVVKKGAPGIVTSYLYNAGVATLTVGSYFKGVLDIYGTTRDVYLYTYFMVGLLLICVAITFYIISILKSIKNKN